MVGTTAHQYIDPIPQRLVETSSSRNSLCGDVISGIPMADVGVGSRRGRVGQLGGGDGSDRFACRLGQLQDGGHRLAVIAAAIVDGFVAIDVFAGGDGFGVAAHGDHLVVHLDPGGVGRHGGGRVGGLGIVGEGLDAGTARQFHHLQIALFPHLEQAGGGEHGGAHAITDKENDVFGITGLCLGGCAQRTEQGGADQRVLDGCVHLFAHESAPYSLAAALILPNTAVLSSEPWKLSAPLPMAPRKTSVPPWVSLPISPTLTTTSWW